MWNGAVQYCTEVSFTGKAFRCWSIIVSRRCAVPDGVCTFVLQASRAARVEVLRHFVALSAVFCARVSVFLPVGCGDGCGWAELGLVCSLSCAVGRFCLGKSTVGLSVCQNWTVRWSSGLILLSTVTSPHLQHILFLQSLRVCPQNLNTTTINTYTTVQKLWNQ